MRITDSLVSTNPRLVSQSAMRVLSAIENEDKRTQVAALGATFLAMCTVFKLDPRHVLEKAERIYRDARYEESKTFGALESYVKGELT